MMSPHEAIEKTPPEVWLTSFYGFRPQTWGYLGFTTDAHRNGFLRKSKPGVLVAVYIVGKKNIDYHGKIVGVIQCSHRINDARYYMSTESWQRKSKDADRAGRWELGVKVVRAWEVSPEYMPTVEDFADITYRPNRAQIIGSQGMKLATSEARRLYDLSLKEIPVFGELPVIGSAVALGLDIFVSSKPGPVSQSPYSVRESEGPTNIYILKLQGNMTAFLGREVGDDEVIKIGISKSPDARCNDFNVALPRCAFRWEIRMSNFIFGLKPWPNSKCAIAGETEIKKILSQRGKSLGGEFFLASKRAIDEAWLAGAAVADHWSKT